MRGMKYTIILPFKNEASNLNGVLDSITSQSLSPYEVLLIDDKSLDNSKTIINSYLMKYTYIKYFQYESKVDFYQLGGKIVNMFHYGMSLSDKSTEWIIKLDADIMFGSNFMEKISRKVTGKKYGIISGTPYEYINNKKILDFSPIWHTHGQFKVYRVQCINEMGGLIPDLAWDGADNIIARSLGWETESFRDILYHHRRPTGSRNSKMTGRIKHGIGAYKLGQDGLYVTFRAIHDLVKYPVIIGSISMLYGYLKAFFTNEKKILNKEQRRLARKLYWSSILPRFKNKEYIFLQMREK